MALQPRLGYQYLISNSAQKCEIDIVDEEHILCIEKLNLKNFCNHVVVTHIPGLRSLEVHFKEGHNITNHNFVERLAIYNANYIETISSNNMVIENDNNQIGVIELLILNVIIFKI